MSADRASSGSDAEDGSRRAHRQPADLADGRAPEPDRPVERLQLVALARGARISLMNSSSHWVHSWSLLLWYQRMKLGMMPSQVRSPV